MPDISTNLQSVGLGEISEVALKTPFIAKYVRIIMFADHNMYSNKLHEMKFDLRLSHPSRFGFIKNVDLKYEDAQGNEINQPSTATGLDDVVEEVKQIPVGPFWAKSLTVTFKPDDVDSLDKVHCYNDADSPSTSCVSCPVGSSSSSE
jgi:hypothetical protein